MSETDGPTSSVVSADDPHPAGTSTPPPPSTTASSLLFRLPKQKSTSSSTTSAGKHHSSEAPSLPTSDPSSLSLLAPVFARPIKNLTTTKPTGSSIPTSLLLSILGILGLSLMYRAAVGLGPHSGEGVPPMRGDFEAQRHWMEITVHLPIKEWYQGSHPWNNLQYWGLDYPPLTAYHSWLFGSFFARVEPTVVSPLGGSRGVETVAVKAWMRWSVLVSDALMFLPVCLWMFGEKDRSSLLIVLLTPLLVVIDHGHFQFNCVAHGLSLLAFHLLSRSEKRSKKRSSETDYLSACAATISFCAALNFKQMTLYYAPAFFFYLLRWVWLGETHLDKALRLSVLGVSVIGSFLVLWLPIFVGGGDLLQVVRRIFPFERGLFEDKVANFWCALNVVIKLKSRFDPSLLAKAALVLTSASILPWCLGLLLGGTSLSQGLFGISLSFFLFSFQVHEKSILLPCVAGVALLAEDAYGSMITSTSSWGNPKKRTGRVVEFVDLEPLPKTSPQTMARYVVFQLIALYSCLPLLTNKDLLHLETLSAVGVFAGVVLACRGDSMRCLISIGRTLLFGWPYWVVRFIVSVNVCVALGLSAALVLATPPARYPDLFVVLISMHACGLFGLFWLDGLNEACRGVWKELGRGQQHRKLD